MNKYFKIICGYTLPKVKESNNYKLVITPEVNLHPKYQRRVARKLAALFNLNNNIVLLTHSDYILKELNTLILLNKRKDLCKTYKYSVTELLDYKYIHAYEYKNKELVDLKVTKDGIEIPSIDKEIDEMNQIQEDIFWG